MPLVIVMSVLMIGGFDSRVVQFDAEIKSGIPWRKSFC